MQNIFWIHNLFCHMKKHIQYSSSYVNTTNNESMIRLAVDYSFYYHKAKTESTSNDHTIHKNLKSQI